MSTRVEIEEIQTTRSEKLLAVVLAVFVFIAGIWTYQRIDDEVREAIPADVRPAPIDQAAIHRQTTAQNRLFAAQQYRSDARQELELRREAYRTALDEGRKDPRLEAAYHRAQGSYARAGAEVRAAQREVEAARPAAAAASESLAKRVDERLDRQALVSFVLRFAFVSAALVLGYWLLGRLRRRGSRSLPLALAVVGASVVLALVLAGDYLTDYVDPVDLGPLVLALFGIAATLVAFRALQRYLTRRIPVRRVRKHECPFCGYPVAENPRCEGCGRHVLADCAACGGPRRVGTTFCGLCGATS